MHKSAGLSNFGTMATDRNTLDIPLLSNTSLETDNTINMGNMSDTTANCWTDVGDILMINNPLLTEHQEARHAAKESSESDRKALIDLYTMCGGLNWTNKENWCSDAALNEWYGVGTETIMGDLRTVEISLSRNNLKGNIPESICNLSELKWLHLSYNQLLGPIPESISKLTKIKVLCCSNNELSGIIPIQIENLTMCVKLDLSNNQLTGIIPESIGNLSSLTELYLNGNNFTGGFPEIVGKLKDLKKLELPESCYRHPGCIHNWYVYIKWIKRLDLSPLPLTLTYENQVEHLKAFAHVYPTIFIDWLSQDGFIQNTNNPPDWMPLYRDEVYVTLSDSKEVKWLNKFDLKHNRLEIGFSRALLLYSYNIFVSLFFIILSPLILIIILLTSLKQQLLPRYEWDLVDGLHLFLCAKLKWYYKRSFDDILMQERIFYSISRPKVASYVVTTNLFSSLHFIRCTNEAYMKSNDLSLYNLEVVKIAVQSAWDRYGSFYHVFFAFIYVFFMLIVGYGIYDLFLNPFVDQSTTILLLGLNTTYFILEIIQFTKSPFRYVCDYQNWFELTICILLYFGFSYRLWYGINIEFAIQLLAITNLLVWINFLNYLRPLNSTGTLVRIVFYVITKMPAFFLIITIVLFGFAQSIWILCYNDPTDTDFVNPYLAWLNSFKYVMSGATYPNPNDAVPFYSLRVFLIVAMIVFVQIILLNLLIAYLNYLYTQIQEHMEANAVKERCAVIADQVRFWNIGGDKYIHYVRRVSDIDEVNMRDATRKGFFGVKKRFEESDSHISSKTTAVLEMVDNLAARVNNMEVKLDAILASLSRLEQTYTVKT